MPASKARLASFVVGIVALVGCGGVSPTPTKTSANVDRGPCGDFEIDVERVWSSSAKAQVRAGVLHAGGEWSGVIAERVVTKMDVFTRSWVMMQEGICKDTLVRKTTTAEIYTKVSMCLRSTLITQQTLAAVMQSPTREHLFSIDKALDDIGREAKACQEKAVYTAYDEKETDTAARDARTKLAEAKAYEDLADKRREAANAAAIEAAKRAASTGVKVDAQLDDASRKNAKRDYQGALADARAAGELAKSVGYELGVARSLDVQGNTAFYSNDVMHALELYRESLSIHERLMGAESVAAADVLNNIGAAYAQAGKFDVALEAYGKALAIKERALGTSSLSTGVTQANIGALHSTIHDYENAIAFSRKALTIYESVLGPNHVDTAQRYDALGLEYLGLKKYETSRELFERAMAIRQKVLDADHPDLAKSYMAFGMVLLKQEAADKAVPYFQKALAIQTRALGPDDLATAETLTGLSDAYALKKEWAKALESEMKVLAIRERVLGRENIQVAQSLRAIAYFHSGMKDYEKSFAALQRALPILERTPKMDRDVKDTLDDIAALCANGYKPACKVGKGPR